MSTALGIIKRNFLRYSTFKMIRGISTTRSSLEKVEEELKKNPYFDKYAVKIAALQQTSPEEFMSRLENIEEKKKSKQSKTAPKQFSEGSPKPDITSVPATKPKTLDSVMKLDLLKDKTPDEIKNIWLDYHKNKESIAAVLSGEQYDQIYQKGKEFPTFVLPLPRGDGYEFILCQFSGHEVHFTPLISYQTHKENAPECLTIIHYADLRNSKDIVLMRGEFNSDILKSHEAQCLANELQLYYGQNDKKRIDLLKKFTYSPQEFKHMDLIAELECLTIK